MLIVGYCLGIRSERRLCEEVHLNLAYRWFCRLGPEDGLPDHSTFSKNRHGRFRESEAFRYVFETVLQRCMAEGLVGGEGFAVDASVVKADASRTSGVPGEQSIDWRDPKRATRAVREYVQGLVEGGEASARNLECARCPLKSQCCPSTPNRKIPRSVHETSREAARSLANTEAYRASRKKRKKVEMLFAHLKRILKLDRLRLRGRTGAQDEFLLAETAQNLRRMAKWLVPKTPLGGLVPA